MIDWLGLSKPSKLINQLIKRLMGSREGSSVLGGTYVGVCWILVYHVGTNTATPLNIHMSGSHTGINYVNRRARTVVFGKRRKFYFVILTRRCTNPNPSS